MAQFTYKVKTPTGSIAEGVIEAPDKNAAASKLRAQKNVLIDISEARVNPLKELLNKINPLKPKVKSKDLVLFSRQLSTLVSAGVPIVQGLSILIDQVESPLFKKIVEQIREDIEAGVSIPEAMAKHPKAFSELYVAMIKAGDEGGILDTILQRLSVYLESAEALASKVKGALVYPAVVLGLAMCVTIFLIVGVIPTFQTIFESFGAELPLPTKILIGLSNILRHYFLIILGVPVALFFAFKKWRDTPSGRLTTDRFFLKLPVFGDLLRKVAVAKFSRTLGTLIKSGVPIIQSLDTVAKTSGNKIIEAAILTAREEVRKGEHIAEPLKKSGQFPSMVVQMIAIGEQTGNLDTMLAKIADFYDEEVDTAVKSLTSLIEPLVMVILGLVIGGIVIAMFMPMFEMGSLAGRE